jgi:HAD superfamily hydrolase (TIGR01490 family)
MLSMSSASSSVSPVAAPPAASTWRDGRIAVALFDLDNTLLPLDSDYAWGEFTTRIGWTDPQDFTRRNDAFFADYQAGRLDVHAYVPLATGGGAPARGRRPRRRRTARSCRGDRAPPSARERVPWFRPHRERGERIAIVTATNAFVTRPIAQAFGVDALIAVELARGPDGWITGEIDGVPSFREGKVTRVAQWLAQQGLGWDDVHVTFYSDSTNDLPLLERADVPVATNPSAGLRELARARGWRILDLFESHP